MASVLARLPSPPLTLANGKQPILGTIHKLAMPTMKVSQVRVGVIAKATGESSESSIIKSVQNVVSLSSYLVNIAYEHFPYIHANSLFLNSFDKWDNSEDRVGLIGFGFAGVVAFWASINIVTAIDKLPVVPSLLELIGLLFTSWFTYRYLLFKPDRQELSQKVSKSISDILGK